MIPLKSFRASRFLCCILVFVFMIVMLGTPQALATPDGGEPDSATRNDEDPVIVVDVPATNPPLAGGSSSDESGTGTGEELPGDENDAREPPDAFDGQGFGNGLNLDARVLEIAPALDELPIDEDPPVAPPDAPLTVQVKIIREVEEFDWNSGKIVHKEENISNTDKGGPFEICFNAASAEMGSYRFSHIATQAGYGKAVTIDFWQSTVRVTAGQMPMGYELVRFEGPGGTVEEDALEMSLQTGEPSTVVVVYKKLDGTGSLVYGGKYTAAF